MPLPYRKAPKAIAAHCAAYIDAVWAPAARSFYSAILIIDSRGQPLEFVYNKLEAPVGFLWPQDTVTAHGVAALCHSLFDACRKEPDLLVCRGSLGSAEYCRTEIAPMIPFAQVHAADEDAPAEWSWINDAPTRGLAAHSLSEALRENGFALEPFDRIKMGLREVYPEVIWDTLNDDPIT